MMKNVVIFDETNHHHSDVSLLKASTLKSETENMPQIYSVLTHTLCIRYINKPMYKKNISCGVYSLVE